MRNSIFAIWLIIMLPVAQAISLQGPSADTTPPVFDDINENVGQVTTITWKTNEPATSTVFFGRTQALEENITKSALVTNHSVVFQTRPGDTYFYQLRSCDAQENCETTLLKTLVSGALFLNATIPEYVRGNVIEVAGLTRQGATVTLFVNGDELRKAQTNTGTFTFSSIGIPDRANITLRAEDRGDNVTRTFDVKVDRGPPIFNVTMPLVTTKSVVAANVSVSETVSLNVSLQSLAPKPERPQGLEIERITAELVELKWKNVTGAREYAIYRNGTRIASVQTNKFQDTVVSGDTTYRYQVATVSEQCQESDLGNSVTASVPSGGRNVTPRVGVRLTCEKDPRVQQVAAGTSTINVDLLPGNNLVVLRATDDAGFTATQRREVNFDTGAPRIVEHNLAQLTPTYTQRVRVKGRVSEKASVTVFVNGRAEKTEPTNEDGGFSIPIRLERVVNRTTTSTQSDLESSLRWPNRVMIQATDEVGLTSAPVTQEVEWTRCGQGAKLDVTVEDPLPATLNPRLMIEGIQELGIAFNYTYRGGYTARINRNQIRLTKLQLSPDAASDYDNNLVQTNTRPVIRGSSRRRAQGEGYAQVKFIPITDPWRTFGDDEQMPANATTYDKENRITEHRKGDCLTPGVGCVKLFFELEIPYIEEVPKAVPELQGTGAQFDVKNEVQKSCINIEVPIDYRIPPKYIPSSFLERTSDVLGIIIEGIDRVLQPVQTIGKYLFYSCIVSTVATYIPLFFEKYNCEYTQYVNALTSEGAFDPLVAEVGKCDEAYAGDDEAKHNCNSCQTSKETRKLFETLYKQLCDRVMCPPVPSFQKYIRSHARDELRPVPGLEGKQAGNHCAKWAQENLARTTSGTTTRRIPPRIFIPKNKVENAYKDWLRHKDDSEGTEDGCNGLQPADAACCGYQYMEEWGSGCGVSALGTGLDTFDEIKESTCLSAEAANQNTIPTLDGGTTDCSNVLNSIGGFCDSEGGEPPTTIRAAKLCCQSGNQVSGLLQQQSGSRDQYLHILLIPRSTATQSPGQWSGEYDIKLGYIGETISIPQGTTSGRHPINARVEAVELGNPIQNTYFSANDIEYYNQNNNPRQAEMRGFAREICNAAGYTGSNAGQCPVKSAQATSLYRQVMEQIGNPEQEFIIRPGDGLVNSIRCICVPTLIAFLQQWKNILTAVRNCLNTILLTGDGEAGVCQAVVSQYACDLLYDAVACFTQKFSTGGPGGRASLGLGGDIVGSLTSAGTELSRGVQGRYGETNMYKALFVDRKLLHSVCAFAFTGTWNLDVGAIFDQAVEEVPVESYGLLFPCRRRFVSFNPATNPKGLTTWVYNLGVGMAAGADAEVQLKLKCSGGYKCRESDGFVRGKCDCDQPREITISPQELPNTVKKGEILSQEIFQVIQGAPGSGQIRWDKAELTWRWQDGGQNRESSAECTISQTGGAGAVPSYCRYDPITLSFRCQLGEDLHGISFTDAKAEYERTIPQGVFALEDRPAIELSVRQTYPDPPNLRNAKFIDYEIKNQLGNKVFELSDDGRTLRPSTVSGDFKLNTKESAHFGIAPTIQRSWFGSATTAGQRYTVQSWSSAVNSDTAAPGSSGLISSVTVQQTNGQAVTAPYTFIMEVVNTNGEELYYLRGGQERRLVDRASGFRGAGSALQGESATNPRSIPSNKRITYTSPTTAVVDTTGGDTRASTGGISINMELTAQNLGLRRGETRQFLITYNPTRQATDPCSPASGRTEPQEFTITFTAYDANDNGGLSEQKSVDPFTDDYVTKEVKFNAICSTGAELAGREAAAGETFLPGNFATELAQLINPTTPPTGYISDERMLQDLTGWTSTARPMPATHTLETATGREAMFRRFQQYIQTQTRIRDELQRRAGQSAYQQVPQNIRDAVTAFLNGYNRQIEALQSQRASILDGGPQASSIEDRQAVLRDQTARTVRAIQTAKEVLLRPITGAAAANVCPDTTVGDALGHTDSTGNVYTCRPNAQECGGGETAEAGKACTGLNTCCKLPAAVNCLAPKTDGYEYSCRTESDDKTGWELAGPLFPPIAGPSIIPNIFDLGTFQCSEQDKTCYRRPANRCEAGVGADKVHPTERYHEVCQATDCSGEQIERLGSACSTAGQKCCRIPSLSLCRGDKGAFRYKCDASNTLSGWVKVPDGAGVQCPPGRGNCFKQLREPAQEAIADITAAETVLTSLNRDLGAPALALEASQTPELAVRNLGVALSALRSIKEAYEATTSRIPESKQSHGADLTIDVVDYLITEGTMLSAQAIFVPWNLYKPQLVDYAQRLNEARLSRSHGEIRELLTQERTLVLGGQGQTACAVGESGGAYTYCKTSACSGVETSSDAVCQTSGQNCCTIPRRYYCGENFFGYDYRCSTSLPSGFGQDYTGRTCQAGQNCYRKAEPQTAQSKTAHGVLKLADLYNYATQELRRPLSANVIGGSTTWLALAEASDTDLLLGLQRPGAREALAKEVERVKNDLTLQYKELRAVAQLEPSPSESLTLLLLLAFKIENYRLPLFDTIPDSIRSPGTPITLIKSRLNHVKDSLQRTATESGTATGGYRNLLVLGDRQARLRHGLILADEGANRAGVAELDMRSANYAKEHAQRARDTIFPLSVIMFRGLREAQLHTIQGLDRNVQRCETAYVNVFSQMSNYGTVPDNYDEDVLGSTVQALERAETACLATKQLIETAQRS